MTTLYLIGSLRTPVVPQIGNRLRKLGYDVFDDWHAAGERADDAWQEYEKAVGRSYQEALQSYAAKHVYEFDLHHLNRSDGGILAMPAGKSGHLELGYLAGQGKPTYVLFDKEPDRWDVMYQFTRGVFFDFDELAEKLKEDFSFGPTQATAHNSPGGLR